MPHNVQTFKDIQPIIDECITKIYLQEAPLYSKHLGVAGRVDLVGQWKGIDSIIDWKTSRKHKKKEWISSYFMQCAAYAIMWEERTKMPITQLVTIMSVDNDHPLVFVEQRDDWTEKLHETIKQYEAEQSTLNG